MSVNAKDIVGAALLATAGTTALGYTVDKSFKIAQDCKNENLNAKQKTKRSINNVAKATGGALLAGLCGWTIFKIFRK